MLKSENCSCSLIVFPYPDSLADKSELSCTIMGWGSGSVAQLFLTLCDPMDCGPPGSSVHGISRARILEWVAISFSRGSS